MALPSSIKPRRPACKHWGPNYSSVCSSAFTWNQRVNSVHTVSCHGISSYLIASASCKCPPSKVTRFSFSAGPEIFLLTLAFHEGSLIDTNDIFASLDIGCHRLSLSNLHVNCWIPYCMFSANKLCRPFLRTYISGSTDYINAVFTDVSTCNFQHVFFTVTTPLIYLI